MIGELGARGGIVRSFVTLGSCWREERRGGARRGARKMAPRAAALLRALVALGAAGLVLGDTSVGDLQCTGERALKKVNTGSAPVACDKSGAIYYAVASDGVVALLTGSGASPEVYLGNGTLGVALPLTPGWSMRPTQLPTAGYTAPPSSAGSGNGTFGGGNWTGGNWTGGWGNMTKAPRRSLPLRGPVLVGVSADFDAIASIKGGKMVVVDKWVVVEVDAATGLAQVRPSGRGFSDSVRSLAVDSGRGQRQGWFYVSAGAFAVRFVPFGSDPLNYASTVFAGDALAARSDEDALDVHRAAARFGELVAVLLHPTTGALLIVEAQRVLYVDEHEFVRLLPGSRAPAARKFVAASINANGDTVFLTFDDGSVEALRVEIGATALNSPQAKVLLNTSGEVSRSATPISQALWTTGGLVLRRGATVSVCTFEATSGAPQRPTPQPTGGGAVPPTQYSSNPVQQPTPDTPVKGFNSTTILFVIGGAGGLTAMVGVALLASRRRAPTGPSRAGRSSNPRYGTSIAAYGGKRMRSARTDASRKTSLSPSSHTSEVDDDDSAFDIPVQSRIPTRGDTVKQLFNVI